MTSVECVVPPRERFSCAVLNLHNCMLISSSVPRCCASRSRQWHPTPALLPGKSHGQRSLVGCSPWGREESDTNERLHFPFSLSCIGEGNGNPLQCSCLENPRDGEPGGLPSVGLHRVGHDWSDLAAAAAAVHQDEDITSPRLAAAFRESVFFTLTILPYTLWSFRDSAAMPQAKRSNIASEVLILLFIASSLRPTGVRWPGFSTFLCNRNFLLYQNCIITSLGLEKTPNLSHPRLVLDMKWECRGFQNSFLSP